MIGYVLGCVVSWVIAICLLIGGVDSGRDRIAYRLWVLAVAMFIVGAVLTAKAWTEAFP